MNKAIGAPRHDPAGCASTSGCRPARGTVRGTAATLIRRWILACGCLLSGLAAAAPAARDELPAARNLAAEAQEAARRGIPLVVLYTQTGCAWCERVRREHLIPLTRNPKPPAVVRQVTIDRADRLVDFQGRRTTSADFARQMDARFAPTVMFHGPDGAQLAEAIVGFRLADFYGEYLDRAVAESSARLRGEQ